MKHLPLLLAVVTAAGGKILGSARHPLGASDYASYLVQAQASGAKVILLCNAGADTVTANQALGFPPDLRNYGIGAQILLDLGVTAIRPITNNPRKLVGLDGYGLELRDRVRLEAPSTEENASYLATKRAKLGHLFAI